MAISISEFIAQSNRGLGQSILGPDYMAKQTYHTVDGTGTNVFTATYGRKVWTALNNQTRVFNALPRNVWGSTVGWRLRTDRGDTRSRPVTETGSIPTVDVSNIEVVSSLPRIVSTTFGASVKSVFTAGLEGGIGDVLAVESEAAQKDHLKELNTELLAGGAYLVSAGGATSFTVPAAVANNFKVGDTVAMSDTGTGQDRTGGSAISAVNSSTGAVTVASGTAFANGDVAYIHSRAGFTSLDDIVSEDAQDTGGGTSEQRAYDLTISDRTAGTWNAAASVDTNAGVSRDLSLNMLDTGIQKIRENGGEPKLIVMGHDQYFKLERLLNSQQRYTGQEEYQVGVGSEKTFPGTRTGLVLATYQGIPILPDADTPKSVSTADAVLGSNIYILDTDYLEIAIAQPTQYIENRDYFAANALVVRGLLYTMGELRAHRFDVHAKIGDLSA
jgi:hypothetical protein